MPGRRRRRRERRSPPRALPRSRLASCPRDSARPPARHAATLDGGTSGPEATWSPFRAAVRSGLRAGFQRRRQAWPRPAPRRWRGRGRPAGATAIRIRRAPRPGTMSRGRTIVSKSSPAASLPWFSRIRNVHSGCCAGCPSVAGPSPPKTGPPPTPRYWRLRSGSTTCAPDTVRWTRVVRVPIGGHLLPATEEARHGFGGAAR